MIIHPTLSSNKLQMVPLGIQHYTLIIPVSGNAGFTVDRISVPAQSFCHTIHILLTSYSNRKMRKPFHNPRHVAGKISGLFISSRRVPLQKIAGNKPYTVFSHLYIYPPQQQQNILYRSFSFFPDLRPIWPNVLFSLQIPILFFDNPLIILQFYENLHLFAK